MKAQNSHTRSTALNKYRIFYKENLPVKVRNDLSFDEYAVLGPSFYNKENIIIKVDIFLVVRIWHRGIFMSLNYVGVQKLDLAHNSKSDNVVWWKVNDVLAGVIWYCHFSYWRLHLDDEVDGVRALHKI